MKRVILLFLVLSLVSACAPKRGLIHTFAKLPAETSGQITIIRNYNPIGSTERYYPTVNGKKVAGLYTKEHTVFQLPAGQYTIGLMFPVIGLNTWWHDEMEKTIEVNRKYYFLLSPTFKLISISGVEIEEIDQIDAEKRVQRSSFIATGTVSENPDLAAKVLSIPSKIIGLKEDEGERN